MKESLFWKKISRHLRVHTNYCERMENRVCQGTPDLFCLDKNGNAVWIELKSIKDLSKKPIFQPQQPVWHKEYAKSGGKSFILVYCGDIIYAEFGKNIDKIMDKDYNPAEGFIARSDDVGINFLLKNMFGG